MVMKLTTQQGYGIVDTYDLAIPMDMLAATMADGFPPAPVTRGAFGGYAYSIDDSSTFQWPMPQDREYDVAITALVLRWSCPETYAANQGEVRWSIAMEFVPADLSTLIGLGDIVSVNSIDTRVPATANSPIETVIGVAPSNWQPVASTDTVMISISRSLIGTGANPVLEPEIYGCIVRYNRIIVYNT
jgi:hypothetical protein